MFHNPYNFVPAPPRNDDPGDGELGNRPPVGHDRFHDGYFTGRITVKMTVATPLLIPDAARAKPMDPKQPKGHRTYPLRLGPDGLPLIPPTSLKGMLRSAYEAVTNSRFGVFSRKHGVPLAYRMEPKEGLSLVPARIENGHIQLMLGTNFQLPYRDNGGNWHAADNFLYAASLPTYGVGQPAWAAALCHGDEVSCWAQEVEHWDRRRDRHGIFIYHLSYRYWRVFQCVPDGIPLGPPIGFRADPGPPPENPADGDPRKYHRYLGNFLQIAVGWVCKTNQNINGKHDERVFFNDPALAAGVNLIHDLTRPLMRSWENLITNYREQHTEQLEERRRNEQGCDQWLGSVPGKTAWSRHICKPGAENLRDGATLCYAFVNPGSGEVEALYPVIISRKLHKVAPSELLPPGLKPATTLGKLSPADRVFGWVRQDEGSDELAGGSKALDPGPSASKGQLRICRVGCLTPPEQAIESFGKPGVPLAILGEPKPQQARFYMAEDENGGALKPTTQPVYVKDRGLRGRKVYPHHHGSENKPEYWNDPLTDRSQVRTRGDYQEYARPHPSQTMMQGNRQIARRDPGTQYTTFALDLTRAHERRDSQNRSVQAWVKPGTQFQFIIDVVNVSKVELGALLFLLNLPGSRRGQHTDPAFHRCGGGKPLGFGSVRLEIEALSVQDGAALRDSYHYVRLGGAQASEGLRLSLDDFPGTIAHYQAAVLAVYGGISGGTTGNPKFEEIPFIAAFLRSCWGFGDALRTHYPRARQTDPDQPGNYLPPHPDGNGYEWFVANKRETERKSLPNLTADRGLDYLDAR